MFIKRVSALVIAGVIAFAANFASPANAEGTTLIVGNGGGVKIVTSSGVKTTATFGNGFFFPLNNPVVSQASLDRAAAYAAYRARLAERRVVARQLRRQRNQQRVQQNQSSGYTFPSPTSHSYLTTDSLGYVTGVDLRSRL